MKYIIEHPEFENDFMDIIQKMETINNNLAILSLTHKEIDSIVCDTSIANDEFFIELNNKTTLHIEVVNYNTAIGNDRDFLIDSLGLEFLNTQYELADENSMYLVIGDYYYREM